MTDSRAPPAVGDASGAAAVAVTPPARAAGSLVGNSGGVTEALRGMACGVLFGITSPLVGAPFDALKTRMQASKEAQYLTSSAWRTLVSIVRTEGALSLYRGLLPPLLGSSAFRSVQFSAYGAAMGSLQDSPTGTAAIPGAAGMQWRVPLSGFFASTCRALIETPVEAIKVRLQVGQPAFVSGSLGAALSHPLREAAGLYRGFGVSWARTSGLMTGFFMQVDHLERHHAELVSLPGIGPFIKGGVCATVMWALVWPAEVLKNKIQSGVGLDGLPPDAGWLPRARAVVAQHGVAGLFRGIGPGLTRSIVANGSSMVVFSYCTQCLRGSDSETGAGSETAPESGKPVG